MIPFNFTIENLLLRPAPNWLFESAALDLSLTLIGDSDSSEISPTGLAALASELFWMSF